MPNLSLHILKLETLGPSNKGQGVTYEKILTRRQLTDHLTLGGPADDENLEQSTRLRIFFLNTDETNDPSGTSAGSGIELQGSPSSSVLEERSQNDVNGPIQIKDLTDGLVVRANLAQNFEPEVLWLSSIGTGLYKTFQASAPNQPPSLSSVEGFYRHSMLDSVNVRDFRIRVWFRHNLTDHSSTYIVHNLPLTLRDKFKTSVVEAESLSDWEKDVSLSTDALIVDMVLDSWRRRVDSVLRKVLEHENLSRNQYGDGHPDQPIYELHELVQNIYAMHEVMRMIVEKIDSIILMCEDPLTASPHVEDSLQHLRSQTLGWCSWLQNFGKRTNIRIQLRFHLATQQDNKINRDIAELTTEIAKQTQKDSSAMMTISVLTLIFLPGTFVASIFSLPFFGKGSSGSLSASTDAWLYPVTAIPFTLLVILVWLQYRKRTIERALPQDHEMAISSIPAAAKQRKYPIVIPPDIPELESPGNLEPLHPWPMTNLEPLDYPIVLGANDPLE